MVQMPERRGSAGGGLPAERLALVRSDAAEPPPAEPRRWPVYAKSLGGSISGCGFSSPITL